jgi:hypothetical protein
MYLLRGRSLLFSGLFLIIAQATVRVTETAKPLLMRRRVLNMRNDWFTRA